MDSKISDLTLVTSTTGDDVFPLVNGGTTKKIKISQLNIPSIAGLATTTYVDTQDNLKVDKVAGKVLSDENYTSTEKTKLGTIASGAEVNVNADWNSVSGDSLILNKPSLASFELQANKQNSLTADGTGVKYPTVDTVNAALSIINTDSVNRVTVKLGEAITKGQAVYVSSASGTNIIVSKASNASEALSSKTIGLVETTGVLNDIVYVVTDGLLAGLNTNSSTIGDPVWLGVNGNLIFGLANKPFAPVHLVYIGVVTRVSPSVGEILIKVQNGFELKEIHDVAVQTPSNNDGLFYETSTTLWKNKSIATILGYTAANDSTVVHTTGAETIAGVKTLSSAPILNSLTASQLLALDGSKNIQTLTTATYPSLTELAFVKGATSSLQTQLNQLPLPIEAQLTYLDMDYTIFDAFYTRVIADSGTIESTNQLLSTLANLRSISYTAQGYTQQLNADKFVKLGGTAEQYLMANGSALSNIATNATTTALSLATLNSTYPSAIIGFRVHCINITIQKVIYEKTSTGWVSYSITVIT